ncbi:MAG: cytochrome b/b6 domain-containing protein [Deltaproteobacteria bacterium]|nr:MAG: cytochrome b/b6 domain-containing protein [Deltaproteobacteria bacterium]
METHFKIKVKNGKKYFFRFTVNQRFQHILLAILVIVLVLTGMPLKFPQAFWAHQIYSVFGGIRIAPFVHKTAGTMLVLLFVYHLIYLVYTFYQGQVIPLKKKNELSIGKILKTLISHPIVPNLKDIKDILNLLKYLLFLTNKRPEGAVFTWKEKFDYWGPFWGIAIMGSTGLLMWNKELFTKFLPGELINFALIAHSDEALLAALFLFIWHFYNVHFSTSVFPMDTVFITGYLSEKMMVEEHYEYYKEIMTASGYPHEILPPHGVRKPESEHGAVRDNPVKLTDLPRI